MDLNSTPIFDQSKLKSIKSQLQSKGFVTGIVRNYLRICLNQDVKDEYIKEIGELIENMIDSCINNHNSLIYLLI